MHRRHLYREQPVRLSRTVQSRNRGVYVRQPGALLRSLYRRRGERRLRRPRQLLPARYHGPYGQQRICGVNCAQGQACPNGYSCTEIIILPQSTPRCGVEVCVVNEGETSGYCSQNANLSCADHKDCPMGPPGGDCPRRDVGNCLIDQTKECSEDVECCDDPTACPEGSCVKQLCRRGGEGSAYGVCVPALGTWTVPEMNAEAPTSPISITQSSAIATYRATRVTKTSTVM